MGSKKNIVAIIQARMGSTRLPGKVLKDVDGVPLLKYQVERVKKSYLIDQLVIATSTLDQDDSVVELCERNGIEVFRGSEDDVLTRYFECGRQYQADIVVRLTGDCPLSDPKIIDDAIAVFQGQEVDYLGNTVPVETSTFPDGSDVEVFSMKALGRAHRECKDPYDREHVTFHFWKNDNGFCTIQLTRRKDLSKYRFTVDYPEDLEVVEFIIKELKERGSFGHLQEIVEIIEDNPEIREKNSKYCPGMGWSK